MTTINAHDYTAGEVITASTLDGLTSDLNTILAEIELSAYIESGQYTGDATTGRVISFSDTGVVLQILEVIRGNSNATQCYYYCTTTTMHDEDPQGLSWQVLSGVPRYRDDVHEDIDTAGQWTAYVGLNANNVPFSWTAYGTKP